MSTIRTSVKKPTSIKFWNGNKSASRQEYELEILTLALAASEQEYGSCSINTDTADYPSAEDEAGVFHEKNFDVFVTVAGNKKLEHEDKIIIHRPLMNGLLGFRLMIVRSEDLPRFSSIENEEELKRLRMGIPATWADADLFRCNGFEVVEDGTYDDIYDRLANRQFDYFCLGANEIEEAFESVREQYIELTIEPTILIYYPFPLVFYVNPIRPDLADRIEQGLIRIQTNGIAESLFRETIGDLTERLDLTNRKIFNLENPILSPELKSFTPTLLGSQ